MLADPRYFRSQASLQSSIQRHFHALGASSVMLDPTTIGDEIDPEDRIPVASVEFTDSRVPGYQGMPFFLAQPSSRPTADPLKEHIEIFVKDIFRIGRDIGSNVFVLPGDDEDLVSRNHCEMYAVKYDSGIHHIYARDRGSCNGTYVNGTLIGRGPSVSSGYLLQSGDQVQILPYWRFTLSQPRSPPLHELSKLQEEEVKLFQDKYTLTNRCLGQGAEATVYLATETLSKKQLVCKLVNLDKIKGRHLAEDIRRRRQEVDILRQLQHPNILPYVDAIGSPHTLYTFTELAASGDLMSFIYRHDTISEFDTQIIIRQVVSGLEYLHRRGIVHRDLKPENILLANSPKIAYCRVMLSDFGASAVPRRNRLTTQVGTMRYQAPEFSVREKSQGPSVDIWSLGIVTLLLLAPYGDREYADLKSLDQQELEISLKKEFFNENSKCSVEAQNFVWQCLRVQAAARLTAAQAARHDWLNSSAAHINFFEKFDLRVRASWTNKLELNAMPWDIPCVLSRVDVRTNDVKDADRPSHFPVIDSARKNELNNQGQCSEEEPTEESTLERHGFHKPALPTMAGNISPQKSWTSAPTPTQKISLKYGERARRIQSKRKRMSELNIRPDLRIHDGMHLPLNNLNRHLQTTPNSMKRRQLLEELKRSKALFLEK